MPIPDRETLLKKSFVNLFSGGEAITDGGYSWIGTKALISDSSLLSGMAGGFKTALCVMSTIFAAVIEYAIYVQNFEGATQYALDGEDFHIIQKMIIDLHNHNPGLENEFRKSYMHYYMALCNLKKKHEKDDKDREKIREYNEKLHLLTNYFIDCLRNQEIDQISDDVEEEQQSETKIREIISSFITENRKNKDQLLKTLNRKKYATTVAVGLIFIASAGAFFSLFSSSSALVSVVLGSLLGLVGINAPIALLIAIAAFSVIFFAVVTYNIVMEIICKDLVQVYYEKLTEAWNDKNSTVKSRARLVVTVLLFLGLVFVTSLATFGTWWITGLDGLQLLFNTSNAIAIGVTKATSVLYAFFTMLFDIKNMLMTLEAVKNVDFYQVLKDFLNWYKDKVFGQAWEIITKAHSKNNLLKLAISVLVAFPLQLIINVILSCWIPFNFFFHCFGEGMATDNAFLMSPKVAAPFTAGEEAFVDGHILGDDHSQYKNINARVNISASGDHQHSHLGDKIITFALTLSLLLPMNYLLRQWLTGEGEGKGAYEYVKEKLSNHWKGNHFSEAVCNHDHGEGSHHEAHDTGSGKLEAPKMYGLFEGINNFSTGCNGGTAAFTR